MRNRYQTSNITFLFQKITIEAKKIMAIQQYGTVTEMAQAILNKEIQDISALQTQINDLIAAGEASGNLSEDLAQALTNISVSLATSVSSWTSASSIQEVLTKLNVIEQMLGLYAPANIDNADIPRCYWDEQYGDLPDLPNDTATTYLRVKVNNSATLDLIAWFTLNSGYTVDWGDGIVNSNTFSHRYNFGVYTIKISGSGIAFGAGSSNYGANDNRSLQLLQVKTNLTTIGASSSSGNYNYCFYNCSSLVTFYAPNLINIGAYGTNNCFRNCYSLATFYAPNLTTIGTYGDNYCFQYCYSLATFYAPNLTAILANASTAGLTLSNFCFQYCYSLATFYAPNLTNIGAYGGGRNSCFDSCHSLAFIILRSYVNIDGNDTLGFFLTAVAKYCQITCNVAQTNFGNIPTASGFGRVIYVDNDGNIV
jgi:hypothetical protein